ncbi:MAG: hypothetical protein IH598_16800 [Bacteroidales bacterium]|nr:hypothetical protein [Bacteroidales bacterium]
MCTKVEEGGIRFLVFLKIRYHLLVRFALYGSGASLSRIYPGRLSLQTFLPKPLTKPDF